MKNHFQQSPAPIIFQGIPVAPGMAGGPVQIWEKRVLDIPRQNDKDPLAEQIRLHEAIDTAAQQIELLSKRLLSENHPEEAAVFQAHIMLVKDKALYKKVEEYLQKGWNAEAAWYDSLETFACRLEELPDPTLCLRAADLRDVGDRVLKILLGYEEDRYLTLSHPSIIVARDLTPSETVSLDKNKVLAFCTSEGGPTSHTAIIAKALCLPAVTNLGDDLLGLVNGTEILVNGFTGEVVASPDDNIKALFEENAALLAVQCELENAEADFPAITKDGFKVEVVANVGSVDDAATAVCKGAEGVGLLRTEFIFLECKTVPDEEEQFEFYKQIFDIMEQRPVVVRTIDAGGDKEIPCLGLGKEANPFLGFRAIRLCLSNPEFFKEQLRALLRAGYKHDLRIMFPMIATLQEVRKAKQLLNEAKDEIVGKGYPLAERIQIGMMIEIPSVVIMAEQFAGEVDFFSVGTNDLTQYTFAADRTNAKVAYLNDHCHPAIIRQIQQASEAAHQAGIWIGVCGEMAVDSDAIPILIGIGVDELSVSPSLIPRAKSIIRQWERSRAEELLKTVINMDSAETVRKCVRTYLEKGGEKYAD